MPGREKSNERLSDIHTDPAQLAKDEPEQEVRINWEPATARSISKAHTSLSLHYEGDVGKLTVKNLGDVSSVPLVEEIEKINKVTTAQTRTPLMTVIQAIVAKAGGSMSIEELAPEVGKLWNRPYPTTPYTLEEFIYLMVRDSDNMRVG